MAIHQKPIQAEIPKAIKTINKPVEEPTIRTIESKVEKDDNYVYD